MEPIDIKVIVTFLASVVLIMIILIVGSIRLIRMFLQIEKETAEAVIRLILRTNALRLFTVLSIVLASTLLALTGIINGFGIVAILSGIAGYVLGSIPSAKEEKYEDKDKGQEKK